MEFENLTERQHTMRHVATRSGVCLAALWLWLAQAPGLRAQGPPRIAAATDLTFALTDIVRQFARSGGAQVELVFGASGALTRQIQDGAPFEMFLSADEAFVNQLAAAGLTRDAGVAYAIGRVVLFVPRGSPLMPDERLEGLERLLDSGGVRRFAIANPEVAPYGRAAEAVLRTRGLWDRLQPSLVLGDSVSQAARFASTGNAVGGIIAHSLAVAPDLARRGTFTLLPAADHPPLRQRMVLLKKAGPIAERFYQYLQGSEARSVLSRSGFEIPQ
jgi:molybdate transport system substrate-binding protein